MNTEEIENILNNEFDTDVFSVEESYGEYIITGRLTTDYSLIGSRLLEWEVDFRFEKEAGIIMGERELTGLVELM
jgi:hypothetical protein